MTPTATRRREPSPWPPHRRAPAPRRGGILRELFAATIILAGLGGCGSLVYGLLHVLPAERPQSQAEAAREPTWLDIGRPIELYALQSPEFGREPRLYEARRHRSGGGRRDVLTYGAAFGAGPYLRLSLYRVGTEPAPAASFFVDLARQAAQAGLAVTRSAQPVPLETKFGAFETADVVLGQGPSDAACLAFRLDAAGVDFRINGLACGTEAAPDRASLSCVIDRLDLISGSGDPPLLRFFTQAEQARGQSCPVKQAGSRTTWLDPAGHAPPLRNSGRLARIQP
jgi:hypothetical protein